MRSRVIKSSRTKLGWLIKEKSLLGCVHVQPFLYGRRRVLLEPKNFEEIAQHLAECPKESCAQLRRSLLLRIRDDFSAAERA